MMWNGYDHPRAGVTFLGRPRCDQPVILDIIDYIPKVGSFANDRTRFGFSHIDRVIFNEVTEAAPTILHEGSKILKWAAVFTFSDLSTCQREIADRRSSPGVSTEAFANDFNFGQ